jgi:hypothetical protein
MRPQSTIDDIRKSRDTALKALGVSVTSVGDQIALTTQTGPYLDQLTKRYQDLMNERSAIREAATDAVLALPSVIRAAATLDSLSSKMKAIAQALPAATDVLSSATAVLSLGQQFSDVITNAQKP